MKMSNRLQAIANLIPKNSIVADIGTDHGYIPLYLIENKISKKVIASDISQGSLNKTISYIKELNLTNMVIPRLGDGLEIIKPFEVDTVIIAGMGGLLIKDILSKDMNLTNSITNFILQPMVASKELREYLYNNNFKIIDEDLVKEDEKYYEIIFAKRGVDLADKDIYYESGKKLIEKKHPLLKEFIESKITKESNIMNNLKDIDTEKSKERFEEIKKTISDYEEVLREIES
ncbi:class I SAM-dependent methyltransferase [Tissierella sp. Yu-01]|uniref:tRNA (adenine(22)-N(1))-methyltransferase n=1 Tax=Tissierella sp. Yu-01 TaxID=3035694 RepID=UPI00240DA1A7|nr:class I SAM-dependent methyltransferase [Tissierella sp. Yu-01]WFA09564.1 class I SAM-dependent methyltransferase [Tissierella sp. Yu-01]